MKKIVSLIMCVAVIILSFSLLTTTAFADNAIIALSNPTMAAGQKFEVTITYNATSSIRSYKGTLAYDNTILKYVSGGDSELNGVITFEGDFTNASTKQKVFSVFFYGLAEGKSELTFNMETMEANKKDSASAGTYVTLTAGNGEIPSDVLPTTDIPVTVDEKPFHIQNDLSEIIIPSGYSAAIIKYNENDVNVLTEPTGKYTLYYLVADDQSLSDWYYLNDKKEFCRLDYVICNNAIYIIEKPETTKAKFDWYIETIKIDGKKVKAYKSTDIKLSDIYILNCYANGTNGYYRYDMINDTIQRAPDFSLPVKVETVTEQEEGFFKNFVYLPNSGKLIFTLSIVEGIAVILLIILLIRNVVLNKKIEKIKEEYDD